MWDAVVWLAVGGLLASTLWSEWASGEVWLPQRGVPREHRQPLRRAESPLLFATISVVKITAAAVLALLLTGRLLPLLQWGL